MARFVEGSAGDQVTLLPECLDDYIGEDNPVRVVDAFVEELDLGALGFARATPSSVGRPAYNPSALLKIYIYGYLNRTQSSRRLERECQRNVELMWLTGRLAPDFKTRYWSSSCSQCKIKSQCTPSAFRRITRWEHEEVLEAVQRRLDKNPDAMKIRRRTVEHVFGTFKHWMGTTPFLTRSLAKVSTEMSLQVLAYNLKRVIAILGMAKTMKAMHMVGA